MKLIKFLKIIPLRTYVIVSIIISITIFILWDSYLTIKGNNILESLLSEDVYHVEIQASDSEFNRLYTKDISEKNEIKTVIETLNQFNGRSYSSNVQYFDHKYHNYVLVLNSDSRGVFIHITNRLYVELQYFDKEKQEYSKRYVLKGKWHVEDLVDLFGLHDELTDYDSETYKGPSLTVGVVGQTPDIREEQVSFKKINMSDLNNEDLIKTYDAVFISHPYLITASEKEYVELYKNIDKPVFFIDVDTSLTPFTIDSYTFSDGLYVDNYIVGLYYDEHQMKDWKFKLKFNIENRQNIEDIYSRVFESIDALE